MRFLSDRGITRIDNVIVSHADADHCGGISLLLAQPEFHIGRVFVNPDPRETGTWNDFVSIMLDAKARGTQVALELTNAHEVPVPSGSSRIEILAPSQEFAIKTANGTTPDGRRLNANRMSAVVRIWAGDSPRLLVAADIDQVGLDSLLSGAVDLNADVFVFPHHGGLPGGSDPNVFAELFTRAVGAKLVIFSTGRGRYGTPRPEIVEAVRRGGEDVHIACTQLSEHCAAQVSEVNADIYDQLEVSNYSLARCAGTLEISLDPDFSYTPSRNEHSIFVDQNAPTALCMRHVLSTGD